MEVNVKAVGKTALKVAGAACIGTGLVVAGAIIASGAAVSSIAEGFVMARKAVADILKKEEDTADEVVENAEAAREEVAAETKEAQPEEGVAAEIKEAAPEAEVTAENKGEVSEEKEAVEA